MVEVRRGAIANWGCALSLWRQIMNGMADAEAPQAHERGGAPPPASTSGATADTTTPSALKAARDAISAAASRSLLAVAAAARAEALAEVSDLGIDPRAFAGELERLGTQCAHVTTPYPPACPQWLNSILPIFVCQCRPSALPRTRTRT